MTYDRKIKNIRLFNKCCNLKNKMQDIISNDLQFEAQEEEFKRNFYSSIDDLNRFIDNIT